jgi:3-hydroxybutyryl-CoA dehydrogenase
VMKRIGIIGTGTMGAGIAQIAGQKRCEVIVQNRTQKSLDLGLQLVQKSLERLVSRDKITRHQADGVMDRIHPTLALEELKGCDIVIESAPEIFDVKVEIFRKLDGIVSEDCIIATNTSSLSVTRLAAAVSRPGHFVGMHFFNPVPAMKLVEVVTGMRTTDSTVIAVRDFAEFLGKLPIDVKDYPGFVVNRVLFPMINEAAFALQEGVSSAKGIDDCMKAGCNHPMGPLAVADLVGLDVVHAILHSLYLEYGNPRYAPCLEITKRVEAGWLGQKTARGFYDYGK